MNSAHNSNGGVDEIEENVSSFQETNVIQDAHQTDKQTCAITSRTSSERLEKSLQQNRLHNQKQHEQQENQEQQLRIEMEWKEKIQHQLSSIAVSPAKATHHDNITNNDVDPIKPTQQESSSFIHGISLNESIEPTMHDEHISTLTQIQTPSQHHMTSEPSSFLQLMSSTSSTSISSAELNYKRERIQFHTSLIKCKRELSACHDKMNELNMQLNTLQAEKFACETELNTKVKQIEALQEQQLTWRAERIHLISLNEELQGERSELQRQLQEAWSMICEMYKSHGKSLEELEEQYPLAMHIRKIGTNKTTIPAKSQNNSNQREETEYLSKSKELLESLVSTLHVNIKQTLDNFMQSRRADNHTFAKNTFTLFEFEKNAEKERKKLSNIENNFNLNEVGSLPRRLWHCQRDFNTFVNLVHEQFAQMKNTIDELQHEKEQQRESMEMQHYELCKKEQEQTEHINDALQKEYQEEALKHATEHARRLLLHAQQSVERTERELQIRKAHLASLLQVSPEWNLIEHAIQHMHLSLSALETATMERENYKLIEEGNNNNNNNRVKRYVDKNVSFVENQQLQQAPEWILHQWRNTKVELVNEIRNLLTLLSTWHNYRERVVFTSRLDALRELLSNSTLFKSYSAKTSFNNEVNYVDVIVKTITTMCECASHFVIKSKTLSEERNALNRLTFLHKCKLEPSGLSIKLVNASECSKHLTTVKVKQQRRCRLKRVVTVTLLCAWWLQRHRAVKEIETKNSVTNAPYLHVGNSQFLMRVPKTQTTQEHQRVKEDDTSMVSSNNSTSVNNDITRSELSDAFASEVLEVIMALDKQVQAALERNNTSI